MCHVVQHGQWARHHEELVGTLLPGQKTLILQLLETCIVKQQIEENHSTFLVASPLHHAKQRVHDMPFLIVHGTKDIVVPIEDSKSAHYCRAIVPQPA